MSALSVRDGVPSGKRLKFMRGAVYIGGSATAVSVAEAARAS
jgi:hypothetical protein